MHCEKCTKYAQPLKHKQYQQHPYDKMPAPCRTCSFKKKHPFRLSPLRETQNSQRLISVTFTLAGIESFSVAVGLAPIQP
jgi:hypothetical protein